MSVRIATVSESSAAAAAPEVEVVDTAAPTEALAVEPAPAADVFEPAESELLVGTESLEAEAAPLDPRAAEWTPAPTNPWTAAAAGHVVRRRPTPVEPIPAAAEPVVALPAVASAPQSKVLSPLPGCNPAPEYPALARRRGIEGVVEIRVRVDADGFVIEREVAASSGSRLLDAAALKAVAQWRFEHGPGEAQIPFRFDLTQ